MSWYKSGAVSVVNGSSRVSGAGTAFVGAVLSGYGFVGPDGRSYEVSEVVSATELTLAGAYLGGTQSGAEYGIFPTYAQLVSFNARLSQLLTDYQEIADGVGVGLSPAGTAENPAVSFAAGPDTGMFLRSSRRIAWATGGVERMNVNSEGLELNVPLVGSAVQDDPYDPTANRVLKPGAFGFSGSMSADLCEDVDDFGIRAGVYQVSSSLSLGVLPEDATVADVMIVLRPSGNQTTQIYSVPNNGNTYVRKSNAANGWGPWRQLMDSGNILGTVSQAGGVPTGAVIERGSNANGEYVRYADGTQICWASLTFDTSITAPQERVFPASFSNTPSCTFGVDASNLSAIAGPGSRARAYFASIFGGDRNAWQYRIRQELTEVIGDVEDFGVHFQAVGRWF